MSNVLYLEEAIQKSGKKKSYLAESLGISRQSFALKCKGKNEFDASEIKILCKELGITRFSEVDAIFFGD